MNFLDSDLIFIPLGGSGEIGLNANLYHYQSDWLMIDLGISFSDETTPVLILFYQMSALLKSKKRILKQLF